MSGLIIFVEGNIGSGKTFFINSLKNELIKHDNIININNINIITEPLNKYRTLKLPEGNFVNPLELFYKGEMTPVSFQFFIMSTLFSHIIENLDNTKINIIERSILTSIYCFNRLFHFNNSVMSAVEFESLKSLEIPFWIIINGYEKKFIFLECDIDTCLDRIKKRNRPEEGNIKRDYLVNLSSQHDFFYNYIKNEKKLDAFKINNNSDYNIISNIQFITKHFLNLIK